MSSVMLNLKEMQAIGTEVLCDVELPAWAQNAEHFVEVMREALESDFVSQNLHLWIDLIFGYKQRSLSGESKDLLFPDTCYGVNWGTVKSNLEKDAFEVMCKEFGQCPEQMFFTPHLPRVFRKIPEIFPPPEVPHQIPLLEKYLSSLQERYQQKINAMLDGYHKAKDKLKVGHKEELDALNKNIAMLKEHIQKASVENGEREVQRSRDFDNAHHLVPQSSHEMLKTGRSPNIFGKQYESEYKIAQEQEVSKTRIESAKKTRKIQSKTPTKPF